MSVCLWLFVIVIVIVIALYAGSLDEDALWWIRDLEVGV